MPIGTNIPLKEQSERFANIIRQAVQPVQPGYTDISNALLSALSKGTGAAGFEESIQSTRAIQQQDQLRFAEAEKEIMSNMVEMAKTGNRDAKAVHEAIESYTQNNPQKYMQYMRELDAMPESVNQGNAQVKIAQIAARLGDQPSLGLQERFKQAKIKEVEQPGLIAEQKELGKTRVKQYEKVQEEAQTATNSRNDIAVLRTIDPETGAFEGIASQVSGALEGLGIGKGKKAANFQAANAIVNQFQFGKLKGEGQVSNFERELVASTIPRLTNVRQAFNFTINRMDNAFRLQQLSSELYDQYYKANNTLDNAQSTVKGILENIPKIIPGRTPDESPLFFSEFEEAYKTSNPDISIIQVIDAWTKYAKGIR